MSRAGLRVLPPPFGSARRSRSRRFARGDQAELAEVLLQELGRDELVFDEGALWRFDGAAGLWRPVDAADESRAVQSFAGSPVDTGKPLRVSAADVAGAMRLAHDLAAKRRFFDDASAGVAFSDGFVRLDDGCMELVPRAREHRARWGYPFSGSLDAAAPRFQAFLQGLFAGDSDAPERVRILSQFTGACLIGRATQYQLAILLVGEGANGKSALLDILCGAMPDGTVGAVPPQHWGREYTRAQLRGVRLNVVSELPDAELTSTEQFKAVVTGDAIDARPIREAPFTFRPSAGHAFATNRLPACGDLSDGFWRRLIVLRFTRQVPEAERDPHLARSILADERPGIVAWALRGARELLALGRYTMPSSSIAEVKRWRAEADSVALFLNEACDRSDGPGTPATQLHAMYRRFCDESDIRAVSRREFASRMQRLGAGSIHRSDARRYPVVPSSRRPPDA